jgi:hypothetical protein
MSERSERQFNWWAQVVNLVLFPLVTLSIAAAATQLWLIGQNQQGFRKTQEAILSSQSQILHRLDRVESALAGNYTQADADRDFARVGEINAAQSRLLDQHGESIDEITGRLSALERRTE